MPHVCLKSSCLSFLKCIRIATLFTQLLILHMFTKNFEKIHRKFLDFRKNPEISKKSRIFGKFLKNLDFLPEFWGKFSKIFGKISIFFRPIFFEKIFFRFFQFSQPSLNGFWWYFFLESIRTRTRITLAGSHRLKVEWKLRYPSKRAAGVAEPPSNIAPPHTP